MSRRSALRYPWRASRGAARGLVYALAAGCASACIDIADVPKRDAGRPDVDLDAEGAVDANFDAGTCPRSCIDEHPSGEIAFLQVQHCVADAFAGPCAAECAPGANLPDPGPPTCTTLGVVSDQPACNVCAKDLCCAYLDACVHDPECLQVGLCVQGRCPAT